MPSHPTPVTVGRPAPWNSAVTRLRLVAWSREGGMTWLRQYQSHPDAFLLRDYPPGEVVRVECRHCPRADRYRPAELIERFGPAAGLPEVLAALTADCPRWQDWQPAGPYGTSFPDLVPKPAT